MKKIIILIIIIFLSIFTYFYINNKNNNNLLEKNILCGEKKAEFLKEDKQNKQNGGYGLIGGFSSFGKVWFSPILNTCILDYYSYNSVNENDNYNSYGMYDLFQGESIGHIGYFHEFGFESPSYLPEICNKDFYLLEPSGKTKILNGLYVKNKKKLQEIYNTEFQFNNCKHFLKGGVGKIELEIYDENNLNFNKDSFNHIIYTNE